MEVSGHAPGALRPGKEPLAPIG